MIRGINKEPAVLVLGDLVIFAASLWLALFLRFLQVPPAFRLHAHLLPFMVVFALFVFVYFIFDLYRKQNSAFRRKLGSTIVRAHILSALLSVILFYSFPYFGITPRAVLILYTLISLGFVLVWRLFGADLFLRRTPLRAAFLSSRPELMELREELIQNPKYNLEIVDITDPEQFFAHGIRVVIFDPAASQALHDAGRWYKLVREGIHFINAEELFEEIFDRVPLSLLDENWFLKYSSNDKKVSYDIAKRVMDLLISVPLALVSLIVYPFVFIAIKIEDGGPTFISQTRVGKNGVSFAMKKFRSMTGSDEGKDVLKSKMRVTRVGAFLRKTRIDELPQLWSVMNGDQSLVGPRPELPELAEVYHREIPYYDMRHLVTPGLSGWAQIYHERHPHHGTAVEQTREKLSYDLYYLKNRSFSLDLKIALKTIKTLISVVGI
jgi:lipopolysaccharide/colanic/teichoic acid biosynthesis glycosyltransferase